MSTTQLDGAVIPETTRWPLRVLVVCHRYFPYLGGIETHVYEVLKRLSKNSAFSITLLTTDLSGKLPQEEVIDGVTVLRVPAWPRKRDYYLAPRIPAIVGQPDRWDLVHCQGIHNFVPLLSMFAARRAKIPYIVSFHTGGTRSGGATQYAPHNGGSSGLCSAVLHGSSALAASRRTRSRATPDSPTRA